MRALIVADIHSNLEALESVFADAERKGFEQVWSTGDVVGYGLTLASVLNSRAGTKP